MSLIERLPSELVYKIYHLLTIEAKENLILAYPQKLSWLFQSFIREQRDAMSYKLEIKYSDVSFRTSQYVYYAPMIIYQNNNKIFESNDILAFYRKTALKRLIECMKTGDEFNMNDIYQYPIYIKNNKFIVKSILEHSGITSEWSIELDDKSKKQFISVLEEMVNKIED